MARKFTSWVDHAYPGSKVLWNVPNITDDAQPEAFESIVTGTRIVRLRQEPGGGIVTTLVTSLERKSAW